MGRISDAIEEELEEKLQTAKLLNEKYEKRLKENAPSKPADPIYRIEEEFGPVASGSLGAEKDQNNTKSGSS